MTADDAGSGRCWQCEAPLGPDAICGTCGVVQPPDPTQDPFTRLGFPRSLALTGHDIRGRRLALLLRLHPDRFVAHHQAARQHALGHAVAINDAARALFDPVARIQVLLGLLGLPTDVPPPDARTRRQVDEFWQGIAELAGVDAHGERGALARDVGARFQRGYDALAAALAAEPVDAAHARALLGEVAAFRELLLALEALDTTPDRLGRRRT
ncbi:MAG: hypothetical protein H6706_30890 [Myxococcales bacterium]|nr:hypothetical protein [Myxococcales bacterium]